MQMMKKLFYIMLFIGVFFGKAQQNPILQYRLNKSISWENLIEQYKQLDEKFPQAKLIEVGKTDCGRSLHLFIIDTDEEFLPEKAHSRNKIVMLVNNGIHPGEPCGIDASLKLASDILHDKTKLTTLKNTVLCIIPLYNVGGTASRGCCSRANQNGPEEYGFRGNARNLDLNRDFIKMDAENTRSFIRIFQQWKPHLFVDTHTTNGADYPYVMTLITTQRDKLATPLGDYTYSTLEPEMYSRMKKRNFPMCPYMNTLGKVPEDGIAAFLETPRYSTGYAALFHCIGFVTEAHMLKPFEQRVEATYAFLDELLSLAHVERNNIFKARQEAESYIAKQNYLPVNWALDTTVISKFAFNGYTSGYKTSSISGLPVLYYDQTKPWKKDIKFLNRYIATDSVLVPRFYIVPQAWKEVVERLKENQVEMHELTTDTVITARFDYIGQLKTVGTPYEGHFLHQQVSTELAEGEEVRFFKGDLIIPTNQLARKFIVETLEPRAVDSYFRWNFYDEILQQKEWFSDYVFEQTAIQLLEDNPELKAQIKKQQKEDEAFAKSHFQQLYFIYKHSPQYEKHHRRYPVGKVF
jgi:hypothetical protein